MISHKEIKKMLAPTQIDYQQTRKKKNTNKTTNNLQENKKTALKEKPQKAMHIKKKKHEKEIVSGTGTVEYINIEGGFYGIIAEDGTHYLPANLNKEFHVDGLRIEFTAETCEDTISFYMWGIPVEIIEINKLK